jgi:hypothetical protein
MFPRLTQWLRWQYALLQARRFRRQSARRRGLSLNAPIFAANPTWRQVLGLAKESTWGTPVTATTFYPTKKPSGFVPQYEDIPDDGNRNNASGEQAFYQGVGLTPIDTGEMLVWPDDSLHWIQAMLGGVDVVAGTNPYTHPLVLLNTGLSPSYTLTLFDNLIATARQVSGFHASEVVLKWSNKARLTMAAKGMGKIAGTVAKPTEAFSAANAFLGWQNTISVSAGNLKCEEGEIRLVRAVDFIYGSNNSQDATDRSVDVLFVSGFLTFAPADGTELAYYTGNTQPATSLVFTSGANTLTVQMTKTAFGKGSDIDRGSKYSKVRLPFKAIANPTDAGAAGNAPIKISGVNTKSTAY